MTKPLMVELYAGLHGWGEGALAEGFQVIGFDIVDMCSELGHERPKGIELVLQDVLTLHGSQFKNAACIVASPPCQAYSYRAMPWSRAKALPPPSNELFDACFRIQREACEAAGRHIPMVVENVRGAQKWVGRSTWHYGSYHLWGDIPALMPIVLSRSVMKLGITHRSNGATNFHGTKVGGTKISKVGFNVAAVRQMLHGDPNVTNAEGRKGRGSWFGDYQQQKQAQNSIGLKQGGDWFGKGEACSMSRRFSSKSTQRKAASAAIAKIPFPLAQHIAKAFKPAGGARRHP